ncbi:MAG: efflux transporter outer membrane subunit [Candidatus Hydrogenedentes bacterium]|nr:efflux transporter outer membrane subunit [Candidatus Hydrogenedentota bacterium]
MSKRVIAVAIAATAVLAGCMTGPDYKRPDVKMPEKWTATLEKGESGATTVATWWTTLNDPVLNSLVERSAQKNHDLRIAEARVREARAARGLVASALWPTLDVSGSYTRSQAVKQKTQSSGFPLSTGLSLSPTGITRTTTFRGQNGSITSSRTTTQSGSQSGTNLAFTPSAKQSAPDRTTDLFQTGFDASWELDLFGGNRRALEAADADIEAVDEFRRDVLVSLISEVALNYIELRSAQNRLDITNKNIKAQEETLKLTRDRFTAGLSSELDAVRAESLLSTTQSQIPMLETQVDMSIHRLSVLLGAEPGALMEELKPSAKLPTPPAEVPVGLPSDLLRRRPDIRQAERELAAATARIGEAQADLFPKFMLTGAFGGRSDALGSVLSGANQIWSFGPSIRLPIFEGGRIRANIEVQNAREEQAAIAYERSILLALEDVENGLVSYSKEQVRRKSLEDAVKSNETAVTLANERYIRGLEGFLNVLQAQQELFQTEDQLVQSESYVLTNLVSLYKALGGGWELNAPEAQSPSTSK